MRESEANLRQEIGLGKTLISLLLFWYLKTVRCEDQQHQRWLVYLGKTYVIRELSFEQLAIVSQ